MEFTQLTLQELLDLQKDLQSQFDVIKQANLKLDLTRGKPSAEQLSLSNSLDSILDAYFVLQDEYWVLKCSARALMKFLRAATVVWR